LSENHKENYCFFLCLAIVRLSLPTPNFPLACPFFQVFVIYQMDYVLTCNY
jgi:hypothetical protein